MTLKKQFELTVKLDVEHRIREGVKAALEEILQEEMIDLPETSYRELTPYQARRGNGHYTRNLLIPAGKIQRLEIPRNREGEFVSEVFERYERMTGGGGGEEAVLRFNSRGSRGAQDRRRDGRFE